jgi:hypothetical protein
LPLPGGIGRRKQWFHAQQVAEGGTLGIVHPAIAIRVHGGEPLVRWKIAKLAEGPCDSAPLLRRKRTKLLHSAAHFGALVEIEVLYRLRAIQEALPTLRGHGIELRKTIAHALLSL